MFFDFFIKGGDVVLHFGADIGVGRRCRGSLKFKPFSAHRGARAHKDTGEFGLEVAHRLNFVSGVGVGVQKRDRHGFNVFLHKVLHQGIQFCQVQRRDDLAIGGHSLVDFKAQVARDEGGIASILQGKRNGAVAAPNLQRVPKTLGGDERGFGAFSLNEGVDDVGGAVL